QSLLPIRFRCRRARRRQRGRSWRRTPLCCRTQILKVVTVVRLPCEMDRVGDVIGRLTEPEESYPAVPRRVGRAWVDIPTGVIFGNMVRHEPSSAGGRVGVADLVEPQRFLALILNRARHELREHRVDRLWLRVLEAS